ncbi:flagellar biosynthetic protein FliQ [Pseudoroseicyclus sp. CXY001]|uniref:flagellar biosynthetic protein FliQ n=1 Tax=Pseudoroseicyclus sp. CXY001 TaxID=3242492 RepID=UPI003571191E
MDPSLFYDTFRAALRVAVVISLPILVVALVTGLAIGLFQALTSVQEMTLTFVPKLAAIVAIFWLSMGFMTETLRSLWLDTLVPLIAAT